MSRCKIKSIIIDNDPINQKLLKEKLSIFVPDVEVMDVACNGAEGLHKIKSLSPDLVFLDVELVDMTGFEMLSKIVCRSFQTIFISLHNHYAVTAIRFKALDYLVKPIDLGELKNAIQRYKSSIDEKKVVRKIQDALFEKKLRGDSQERLILQTHDGELKIRIRDIVQIEGFRNYSYIHYANNKKKLISKTIRDLEGFLDAKDFFRCHRSHLVNFNHVISFSKNTSIVLTNGDVVPISRRRKEEFLNWYEGFSNLKLKESQM